MNDLLNHSVQEHDQVRAKVRKAQEQSECKIEETGSIYPTVSDASHRPSYAVVLRSVCQRSKDLAIRSSPHCRRHPAHGRQVNIGAHEDVSSIRVCQPWQSARRFSPPRGTIHTPRFGTQPECRRGWGVYTSSTRWRIRGPCGSVQHIVTKTTAHHLNRAYGMFRC
jgi:hypothetical protein